MPGYQTKQESIAVAGVADLIIRSLLDRQQFADPLGVALALGISSAAWPLFGLPWPSGTQLAVRMAARQVNPGERILEIGCGLGLASLVAHRRGADVTASDCHPLAAHFMRENLLLNRLPPMKYRHGQWADRAAPWPHAQAFPEPGATAVAGAGIVELAGGSAIDIADEMVRGRFHLIVGSDVLYERDREGALAGFIAHHATDRAEVWIVDPDRGNRADFNRRMASHGFVLRELRLDRPAAGELPAYKGRLLSYHRAATAMPC